MGNNVLVNTLCDSVVIVNILLLHLTAPTTFAFLRFKV